MNDPIDNVVWLAAEELNPNFWNPNHVFGPEMKLLELSILTNGWVFPIIINKNKIIIDGYHRHWTSLNSKKIVKKYNKMIPCVVLDIDDDEAMMMTVRMNRAKGTHIALKMSSLVQRLHVEHGKSVADIAVGIGATKAEVELLLKGDVFKSRDLTKYEYSKAWVPMEVTAEERTRMIEDGVTSAEIASERDSDEAPDI